MSNHELYAIPDPMIGHQIGRYVIRRKLAEGGMGAVYLATHERLENTTKVIKILLPVYARNPILRERFEREALAVSRMRHKHIVTIDDYGQLPDGQLFLMMPFLQGQSLETYLHGAQEAARQQTMQALAEVPAAATPAPTPARLEEVLTFEKWFHGRFWTEWVIAQKNKPSESRPRRASIGCTSAQRSATWP